MKKLGLVGGISWVSTVDYYRYINQGINAQLGGLNFAECVVYSLNFGDIQAAQWDNSYELLLSACQSLKRSGVDAIVLCANTAHLFSTQLQDAVQLPVVDIVTATVDALQAHNIEVVGFLGTKFTMEMAFFKDRLRNSGIEVLIPPEQKTRDYIQATLKDELGKGIVREATKSSYLTIINELVGRGADALVLACTEIPLMIGPEDVSVPIFDTMRLHADAAVAFALL